MLKGIFQGFRPKAKDFNTGHFNIPKFYTLMHFKENICLYGYTNRYCTGINSETRHHYIVKMFYDLINKQDSLSQICFYNLRQVIILAIKDKIAFANSNSIL